MKKYACSVIGALLALTVTSLAEFTQPTEAQIASAAQTPSEIGALLTDATDEQAVAVINAVVAAIDALDITEIEKKQRCTVLFAAVATALGERRAQLILVQVVATMPPGLVPETYKIQSGPRPLPRYKRQ
jgi:hypothetical protein